MPLINVPIIDDRDVGRGTLSGAAWGPIITADFSRVGDPRIVIQSERFHSQAAWSDGVSRPDQQSFLLTADEVKAKIATMPEAFAAMFALVDVVLQEKLGGGDIVPADLAAWMPTPAPDPPPQE